MALPQRLGSLGGRGSNRHWASQSRHANQYTQNCMPSIQFTFLHKGPWLWVGQGVWGMRTQNTGHLSHTLCDCRLFVKAKLTIKRHTWVFFQHWFPPRQPPCMQLGPSQIYAEHRWELTPQHWRKISTKVLSRERFEQMPPSQPVVFLSRLWQNLYTGRQAGKEELRKKRKGGKREGVKK